MILEKRKKYEETGIIITNAIIQELSSELESINARKNKIKSEMVEALQEELNNIKIEKLQKNFLDVIRRNRYDENLISDWLCFLLNPEINGIGNLTRKIFWNYK